MKDQLTKALDQALANEVDKLFNVLVMNLIAQEKDAAVKFGKGMSITIAAYGQAKLLIDKMIEV